MPEFSKRSWERLWTCERPLVELFTEVVIHWDCTIICGHRNQQAQDEAYAGGFSKVKFPHGKHNTLLSEAVDVAPYPIDWDDTRRFAHLIGIIRGIAIAKGIKIRVGIDWDSDGDITDHKFMDWPHFELVLED